MSSKLMIVLRGPPGSGKSYFANYLEGYFSVDPLIISIDNYRIVEGKYKFDPSREKEVIAKFKEALRAAVVEGAEPIIVDNCHSRFWEFESTKKLGEEHGYTVFVVEVQSTLDDCLQNQSHNLALEKMMDIFERWESWYRRTLSSRIRDLEVFVRKGGFRATRSTF